MELRKVARNEEIKCSVFVVWILMDGLQIRMYQNHCFDRKIKECWKNWEEPECRWLKNRMYLIGYSLDSIETGIHRYAFNCDHLFVTSPSSIGKQVTKIISKFSFSLHSLLSSQSHKQHPYSHIPFSPGIFLKTFIFSILHSQFPKFILIPLFSPKIHSLFKSIQIPTLQHQQANTLLLIANIINTIAMTKPHKYSAHKSKHSALTLKKPTANTLRTSASSDPAYTFSLRAHPGTKMNKFKQVRVSFAPTQIVPGIEEDNMIVYNSDKYYWTDAFILKHKQEYFKTNPFLEKQKFAKVISDKLLYYNRDTPDIGPNTPPVATHNYCQICKCEFDNGYYEHIYSEPHLEKMKGSEANTYISELIEKYSCSRREKSEWEGAGRKQGKKIRKERKGRK